MTEEKKPIISKYMIAFAFISPFLFSVSGMLIAYFSTRNSSSNTQKIALIVATFVGLLLAIVSIFALQKIVNRKIEITNSEK